MIIPITEVNWPKFYRLETAKGNRVVSRYIGVSITDRKGHKKFIAKYGGKLYRKYLGEYPLTAEGERAAYEAYRTYVNSIPAEAITNRRGRIMLNKSKQVIQRDDIYYAKNNL